MAIDSKKYTVCLGALYAINGLLPPEYRVEIDDEIYREKTKTDVFVYCTNAKCEQKFDYNLIKIVHISTTPILKLVTGKDRRPVWICPKCKNENPVEKTRMVQTTLKEPYFLKVVPKPPERQDGILDRKSYMRKFERWAWTFIDELEERMAQYRDDNWERGGGMENTGTDIESNFEEEVPV